LTQRYITDAEREREREREGEGGREGEGDSSGEYQMSSLLSRRGKFTLEA